jgi:hypothetical protein
VMPLQEKVPKGILVIFSSIRIAFCLSRSSGVLD